MSDPSPSEPVLIKKYGNRRLYDTGQSRYITLDDLAAIVKGGALVKVVEASSDRDITRQVLLQVILEQQDALNLVPIDLLHTVLRVQGTLEQAPFAAYLSAITAQLATQGSQLTQQLLGWMGGIPGYPGAPGAPRPAGPQASAPPDAPPDARAPGQEAPSTPPASTSPPGPAPGPGDAGLADVRLRMDALLSKLGR